MAATRIIKKYPNRRLYDTEISSYITIEDVRQLILDGESFEVRDAKSGEDLTRSVLLQIIAEHEQDGQPMLSTQLLSHLHHNATGVYDSIAGGKVLTEHPALDQHHARAGLAGRDAGRHRGTTQQLAAAGGARVLRRVVHGGHQWLCEWPSPPS